MACRPTVKKNSFAHVLDKKSVEVSLGFARDGPTAAEGIIAPLSRYPLFVPSKLEIGCEPEPAMYDRRVSR